LGLKLIEDKQIGAFCHLELFLRFDNNSIITVLNHMLSSSLLKYWSELGPFFAHLNDRFKQQHILFYSPSFLNESGVKMVEPPLPAFVTGPEISVI
jgi:hypothetical protein